MKASLFLLSLKVVLGQVKWFILQNQFIWQLQQFRIHGSQFDTVQIPEGNPKHSPTSGEIAIYKANCLILQKVLSSPCYFHSSLFYSYHAAFGVLGYCFGSLKVYGPVILHCPIFKHFLQNPQVFRTCCCTFWTAASLILEPDANKYHIDSSLCL